MARPVAAGATNSDSDQEAQLVPSSARRRRSSVAAASAALLSCVALAALLNVGPAADTTSRPAALRALSEKQHFWIVRHGDKYSSYPPCPAKPLCFDKEGMNDNPPLTACGIEQANVTAHYLKEEADKVGGVKQIVVSPFARTLMTALPLAKALDMKLKVEYLLSEANQGQGPFRPLNLALDAEAVQQLAEADEFWDLGYGSPPIPTPEDNELYQKRVVKAAKVIKERFPPSAGNTVVYTHATTSFSLAYGLCHLEDSTDAGVMEFVNAQDAIGPGGFIHVVLDDGKCVKVDQTKNVAQEAITCGETHPFKCNFADFPAWYWPHSLGPGPGNCH